ncbi:MAG: COX15/CtaA family protein, partial [Candidatus Anammoxibacter sp.]
MVLYRKMAFISTTAVYLLIFIGGLVRVAGAGLGCPDWPKCFG